MDRSKVWFIWGALGIVVVLFLIMGLLLLPRDNEKGNSLQNLLNKQRDIYNKNIPGSNKWMNIVNDWLHGGGGSKLSQ